MTQRPVLLSRFAAMHNGQVNRFTAWRHCALACDRRSDDNQPENSLGRPFQSGQGLPRNRLARSHMTAAVSTHLVIADDHPLFRDALRQAVASVVPSARIGEAGSFEELTALLERDSDVDLVLLDLTMPGISGFSGLIYLRAQYPAIPVVIVSASDDGATIRRSPGLRRLRLHSQARSGSRRCATPSSRSWKATSGFRRTSISPPPPIRT